jgi:hypothetical protein
VILELYPHRQGEKIGEALLEPLIARDLAPDVANYPAEPGAQEFVIHAAPD